MARQNLDREIRTLVSSVVDSLVEDLSSLVEQHARETVLSALGGAPKRPAAQRRRARRARPAAKRAAPAKRGTRKRAAGAGRKRGARRSSTRIADVQKRFFEFVKKNPGKGMGEIAKGIRANPRDLRFPARKLVDARKLKSTGQRRGTKYFPV